MKNLAKWAYLLPVFLVFTISFYGFSYAENFDPLGGLSGGRYGSPTPAPSPESEVKDLDDLTEGAEEKEEVKPEEEKPVEVKPDQIKSGDDAIANEENSSEDEFSLTIAECLIMEQLGIKDEKCDKLKLALDCPDYTSCVGYCGKMLDVCFDEVAKWKNIRGDTCRSIYYDQCLPQCAGSYKECAQKYSPKQLELPQSQFELLDASGDVRITYIDNPTPADMSTVKKDMGGLVGATIFTGEKSGVTLKFSDEVSAYVGQNAYFRIDDFYATDKFEKARVFLGNGQVKVLVNQRDDGKKKYSYVIMTPLWKAEVKGTELTVTVEEDGKAMLETISGEVAVYDFDGKLLANVGAGEKYEGMPSGVSDEGDLDVDSAQKTVEEKALEEQKGLSSQIYSYEDFLNDQRMKKWAYGLGAFIAIILVGALWYYLKRRR